VSIAKSKHFKLKDLADTLNCDVNNLKLTFKSQKKRQTSLRGKELQKFNIELFSIRTTTQPRKPVKTVSSEIKKIEKTSEIQVIKAKFEDVSNKLTKTEKLLSNLKLLNVNFKLLTSQFKVSAKSFSLKCFDFAIIEYSFKIFSFELMTFGEFNVDKDSLIMLSMFMCLNYSA
jgi:hypothetical protein